MLRIADVTIQVKEALVFLKATHGFSKALAKEILPKHLYFGHFTSLDEAQQTVDLAQNPNEFELMIEVISCDFAKGVYNFYELIGFTPTRP